MKKPTLTEFLYEKFIKRVAETKAGEIYPTFFNSQQIEDIQDYIDNIILKDMNVQIINNVKEPKEIINIETNTGDIYL